MPSFFKFVWFSARKFEYFKKCSERGKKIILLNTGQTIENWQPWRKNNFILNIFFFKYFENALVFAVF